MKIRIGKSKWEKWNCINRDETLEAYQPVTSIYSLDRLQQFLAKYPFVYVKPDGMSLGRNVIRVTREGNGCISHKGTQQKKHDSLRAFDRWLSTLRHQERYLVQQGISFKKVENRPVDLRMIVLKNEQGQWEVTAMVAKQAAKGSAITNVAQGGKLLKVEDFLARIGLSKSLQKHHLHKLHKLSSKIGERFGSCYSNYIYGLDIGFDERLKLWLIEANTKPDNRFLPGFNRQMYKRTQELINYNK